MPIGAVEFPPSKVRSAILSTIHQAWESADWDFSSVYCNVLKPTKVGNLVKIIKKRNVMSYERGRPSGVPFLCLTEAS